MLMKLHLYGRVIAVFVCFGIACEGSKQYATVPLDHVDQQRSDTASPSPRLSAFGSTGTFTASTFSAGSILMPGSDTEPPFLLFLRT
jgi:hypothetical protein